MKSEEAIRRKVKELLNDSKITAPPVLVDQIAEHLNIKVQYAPLQDDVSGLLYRENKSAVIGVNGLHSSVRQRFTIAHELGHYVLGRDGEFFLDRPVLFRSDKSRDENPEEEKDANAFAAELLMPEEMVLEEIASIKYKELELEDAIKRLARVFNVSMQAMLIRLQKLNLIPM
jgi:Zn-dependent peptidase ImmA (M78 family)